MCARALSTARYNIHMKGIDRRSLLAGTAATVAGLSACAHVTSKPAVNTHKPNILIIILDQFRTPRWFPSAEHLDTLLPHIAQLRKSSVSFTSHYTASNMCTPARSTMLTGLYTHQTGCLFTTGQLQLPHQPHSPTAHQGTHHFAGESVLSSQFPTWGSMLRDEGYHTWWWGKWHLGGKGDTHPEGLEEYGFSGGTYPSPNGAVTEGLRKDPNIVEQFSNWFEHTDHTQPWCTTVSLVNPHDICWYPTWEGPSHLPSIVKDLPANYENAQQLIDHKKPRLQADYKHFMSQIFGSITEDPHTATPAWIHQRNLYLWLQQHADKNVGHVLATLEKNPEVNNNTIVVFTSDHGEYAGSHGLMGKGGALYEEAINVPLYIRDPRGKFVTQPGSVRTQLTSSVDLVPLLLTLARGNNTWRSDKRYDYLSSRADIAHIAANPEVPGRQWVAHLTDDMFIEETSRFLPSLAPSHVAGVRTAHAKLGMYSHWKQGGFEVDHSAPLDRELYVYPAGTPILETKNLIGHHSPAEHTLNELYHAKVVPEIHARLPHRLQPAVDEGLNNMLQMEKKRQAAFPK